MGSLMRAVKSAVIAGLTTEYASLDDFNGTTRPEWKVSVSYGYEWDKHDTERVFCGRGTVVTPTAGLRPGMNHRNEQAEFDLMFVVSVPGGSQEDADDRAFDVLAVAESWIGLRKSNQLGITGLNWLVISGYDHTPLGNDRGHMAEIALHITYNARLTS